MSRLTTFINTTSLEMYCVDTLERMALVPYEGCFNSNYVRNTWLSSEECRKAPCGSCQVYLPNLMRAMECLD